MKTFPTICILFSIISMSSCKKEEVTAPIFYITFAKEALAYAQLPLNRYFIYRDSTTGNLDSVAVTTSNMQTSLAPAYSATLFSFRESYPAYYYQDLTLILTKLNGTQTSWYNVKASSFRSSSIHADSLAPLTFGGYDSFLSSNSFISAIGFSSGVSFGTFTKDILQSLSVEGNTYNNVLRFVTATGADYDSTKSWYYKGAYYWAKGVGIIKRTGTTSAGTITSNLVRYGR